MTRVILHIVLSSTLAVFLLSSPGLAQEIAPSDEAPSVFSRTVRLELRTPFLLSGHAFRLNTGQDFRWHELYGLGVGLALEGDFLWGSEGYPTGMFYGGYINIGFENFSQGARAQSGIAQVTADSMTVGTFVIGGMIQHRWENEFFLEARAGAGMSLIESVDADFVFGGVPSDVELFDSTVVMAGDVGIRIGKSFKAFKWFFGLNLRVIGGPDEGSDVSLNSGSLISGGIDGGISLDF